jgi:hypothetical protein
MKTIILISSLSLTMVVGAFWAKPNIVLAQTCNYFAGTAVTGKSVNIDLCSIVPASSRSVDFVYYLGNQQLVSQANCDNGTWTTFPERQIHRPRSQATQTMLEVVCSYRFDSSQSTSRIATAIVFSPPSNVRTSPNGNIICSVRERRNINIYGSVGSWYYTDVCGEMGLIHSSQIKFDN